MPLGHIYADKCCAGLFDRHIKDEPTLHITQRLHCIGDFCQEIINLVAASSRRQPHGLLCNLGLATSITSAFSRFIRITACVGLIALPARRFSLSKSAQHNAPGTDQERVICDKFKKLFNHFASDLKKFERQYTNVALSAANR